MPVLLPILNGCIFSSWSPLTCSVCKESSNASLASRLSGEQTGVQTLLNRLVPGHRQTHPHAWRQEMVVMAGVSSTPTPPKFLG